MNKVILLGYLTKDPEVRFTRTGTAVCECTVALNEKYKDQAGNTVEKTAFVDFHFWGTTGENFAKFFSKGEPAHFEGKIEQQRWEDKATGQNRSKIVIKGERWYFIPSTKTSSRPPQHEQEHSTPPPQRPAQPSDPGAYRPEEDDEDEESPF